MFADDTNQFVKGRNASELIQLAERETANVLNWCTSNKLSLNIDKSNFSLFCPLVNDSLIDIKEMKTPFGVLSRASFVKYLGVYIEESLTWKKHIEFMCTKIKKFCGIFYKIRFKIPQKCLKTLYYSLIYPTILYGIEIYANTKITYLDELIKLNNKILRILQFKDKNTTVQFIYIFSTLMIPELHSFQLLLFAHKFKQCRNLLPASFTNYFVLNTEIHDYNTRNKTTYM